jgi:RNA polymerase sigma factor (sigma-70 family)
MAEGGASDADVIAASVRVPERFASLFDRHFDAIYVYLRRRVGPEIAEDLAAQTFEEAFRLRSRFDVRRPSARPWLFGIATNLLRNHARRGRRERRALSRAWVERPESDGADATVSRVDAAIRAGDMARALATLPDAERDAILLLAWGDLTYDEIADALDVPVGTVRSRLSRGRTKLREHLVSDGQEHDEDDVRPGSGGSRAHG